ncbi:hypothetical protein [Bordetella bronchiseptica]|uniref:hypothetical protein n=1 Tax=Bordetella bronchiseptica TaxID=518 RepID=UPI00124586EA|nr:hypothetical protein [Bordetella bronchiseptica]KAB1444193.1 hypothetical protein F7D00_21275 [Bordetella bronchiseptica]KAB1569299.1 hypothetical protein F7890_21275 [Bordetella bronchiseptica]
MRPVHVPLGWHRIDWMPGETWGKDILQKLRCLGIKEAQLRRCVYVIRLNGDICIDYPGGESPTIYIGEGRFAQRIKNHSKWATKLEALVGEFSFQVCIAMPRVQKNRDAYRDAEAALLEYFGEKYGTTPLWNKQYETRTCLHYEYNEHSLKEAVNKRSGAKYRWAIRPMKSSEFHRYFDQPPRK